jgi:hypothetical protein
MVSLTRWQYRKEQLLRSEFCRTIGRILWQAIQRMCHSLSVKTSH